MDPADAAALASQVSTAVGAVLGAVIAGSAAGVLPPGPGAMAIIGQVQVLSQLGKVGGGGGALGAFSEGFAWANFELPFSLFPEGNEPEPDAGNRRAFRRIGKKSRPEPGQTAKEASVECDNATMTDDERATCRECGMVDGIPLLDKLSLVAMSIGLVFCIRASAQLVVTKCMKKDPWDALNFPNWEGPLLLAQWFGMCDSLTATLGRPCPFWLVLACLIIFVGPILFLVFAAWKISRLVRTGVMAYEDVEKVTWKETREKMSSCKTLKEKLGPLQEWYHAKRNKGEWTEDTKESKFWRFLTKDFSQKAWKYCMWLLVRKFFLALVMTLTLGAVNAGCVIILQVVDVSVICFMNPFTDNAFQVSEVFGAVSNLLTMILAAMPVLYGAMPEALGDFIIICCALMGTVMAAITTVVGPIFGFFGAIVGGLVALVGGGGGVGASNLAASGTLLAAGASIRDSLQEMAEDALEELGAAGDVEVDVDSGDVAAVGVGVAAVGGAAYCAGKIGARDDHTGLSGSLSTTVKLGLDFSAAGEEGSGKRREFEADIIQDLANAADEPDSRFDITRLSPGSIIVEFSILDDPTGHGPPASAILQSLQEQADVPSSKLRMGSITRHTETIYVTDYLTRQLMNRRGILKRRSEEVPASSKTTVLDGDALRKDIQSRLAKRSVDVLVVGDALPDQSILIRNAGPPTRTLPPLPHASRNMITVSGCPESDSTSMLVNEASSNWALSQDAGLSSGNLHVDVAIARRSSVQEGWSRQDEWAISYARRRRLLVVVSQWRKCVLPHLTRTELRAAKLGSQRLSSRFLDAWLAMSQERRLLRAEESDSVYLDKRRRLRMLSTFMHSWSDVLFQDGGPRMTFKTSQYGMVIAFHAAALANRNSSVLKDSLTKWLLHTRGLGNVGDHEGSLDSSCHLNMTGMDESGTPSPPPSNGEGGSCLLQSAQQWPQRPAYDLFMFSQRSQCKDECKDAKMDASDELGAPPYESGEDQLHVTRHPRHHSRDLIRPKYYEADSSSPAPSPVILGAHSSRFDADLDPCCEMNFASCAASNEDSVLSSRDMTSYMTSPPISRGLRAAARLREHYADYPHTSADASSDPDFVMQRQGSESSESNTSGSLGSMANINLARSGSPPHVNGVVSDLIGAALAGPGCLEQKLDMLSRTYSSLGDIAEKLERRAESHERARR